MLNQFVGVGRLVAAPEVKETEDGKKVSNITIAVPRSYKNAFVMLCSVEYKKSFENQRQCLNLVYYQGASLH